MTNTLPPGGGAFALNRFGLLTAHSVEECRRLRQFLAVAWDMTAGHAPDRFVDDQAAVYGAAHALMLAGEAAGRTSQNFRNATPDIPWNDLLSLRNQLAHAQSPPDAALIAALAYDHVPGVLDVLDSLLFEGDASAGAGGMGDQ